MDRREPRRHAEHGGHPRCTDPDAGLLVVFTGGTTGDLGFVDDDGDVHLRGRKKKCASPAGTTSLPEIEETPTDHPDVEQAVVIGVEDDSWGEAGHAFVLRRPGSDLDEAALEEYADEELADYKQPVAFTVESELPLTTLGKIDRQAIIESYELDPV